MHRKDTDYLHAAARTAYLENMLISGEALFKAAAAESVEEVQRQLSGKALFRGRNPENHEEIFEGALKEAYELVEEMTGGLGVTFVFRYHIDGHNMKVMVKSRAASGDFSYLYKDGGTVETAVMAEELGSGRFYMVPEKLGRAGLEAVRLLAGTGDPQTVDIIIDNAVLALMNEKAAETGFEALSEYAAAVTDVTNLRAAFRMLDMKADAYMAESVFSEGGSLSAEELNRAYIMGYESVRALADKLFQPVEPVTAETFERTAEEYFMRFFDRISAVPFGIEPVIRFLYLKEREIKGCRLVLASKDFGISENRIMEGLRCIYGS